MRESFFMQEQETTERRAAVRHELDAALARLREVKDPSLRREAVARIVADAVEAARVIGGEYFEDVDELYRQYAVADTLVRRDDPARLLDVAVDAEPYVVSFAGKQPFANGAAFGPRGEGMANALLEGFSGDVVAAVVGFDGGSVDAQTVPDAGITKRRPGGASLSRAYVRAISGTVAPDDLRFIILRIPKAFFPDDQLRPEEEERTHILRGIGIHPIRPASEERAAA